MLDPQTYRANEQLAKSQIPSWRISQIHNVDHFERAGFPVRLGSVRELGQIIDTMQENRFEPYLNELGGLSDDEFALILEACKDSVLFQLSYLPSWRPVLPISTLLSAFALFKKMKGSDQAFRTVLEIGPGCGYLSFFLRHHAALENYSQIEACESFYILQNLVNHYCFGHRMDERAMMPAEVSLVDYFINARPDMEFSPKVRLGEKAPLCTRYPWWRIGEIASRDRKFDIVTSNANLLEFNAPALDDYLTLMHRALKPDGVFLVQCTGFTASGTVEQLLEKIYDKKFAPLMFVREHEPSSFPDKAAKGGMLDRLMAKQLHGVKFTTNNAVFVKAGHPLFDAYYKKENFNLHFVAPEQIVSEMFFERPTGRKMYTMNDFLVATEKAIQRAP
jgi:SAM-dependent methyltransferase